ncbi:MAG TPA: SDR family oxidoreductase [Rhodothermales bacterium]|nr:SDR family oxidoreductase [Rhodothermales bacterium]
MNLKPASDQTVVLTGATSGIGLATALEFAKKGARLVLVARDDGELAAVEERVRDAGAADVLSVAADVADRGGVEYVAQQATERFGWFDTWINDAGVSVYGEMKDVPEEDARQVFETNYWGVVHGSLVAAEAWRSRESERAACLINVGSILSDRAIPLQGHYSASKHAVKGFTDALRMELEKEGVPVSVTLIKPSAINTPYPQHAGNYMKDATPTLPQPVYEPEVVARAIVACAERPTRELTVGAGGRMISMMGTLAPRLTDRFMEATQFDAQKRTDRPVRQGPGAVQEPQADGNQVHGDVKGAMAHSLYTQAKLNPGVTFGVALAAGVALGAALLRR